MNAWLFKALNWLAKMFRNLLTEADNQTFDLGRVLWGLGGLVFFGLSIHAYIYMHDHFDPIGWGAGFGGYLTGGGASIAIKSRETT